PVTQVQKASFVLLRDHHARPATLGPLCDLPGEKDRQVRVDGGAVVPQPRRNADTRAGTNFSHPPVEAEKPMAPGGHELASVVQPDPADFLPYVLPVQPSDPSGHDAPVLGEGVHGQRLGRRTPFTLAVEGESGRVSSPDVLRL